jgi:hypothetical protein
MTATTPPAWAAPAGGPRRSWGAGRIVALIFGILLLIPGLALLGGGGTLLAADWTGRDDGFLFSPEEDFVSPGYALVSERIDLRTDADWLPVSAALGTAQVEITGVGQEEVFVGIAPVADATAYLGGVQRTVIDDLGFDNAADNGDQVAGDAPSGPPADQDFWTTQSTGPGSQQLTWEPAEGDWMLVVMNADGAAGVQVQGRIGAEFPAITGLAWGVLIGGLLLTAVAVLLLVIAARTPRDRRPPLPFRAGAVPPPRGPATPEFWGPGPARMPQDQAAPAAPGAGTPGREPGPGA